MIRLDRSFLAVLLVLGILPQAVVAAERVVIVESYTNYR
jgi:hypothetical protein